jgi:hypothetical protein
MPTTIQPKFNPGVLLATSGASEAFARNNQTPLELLQRHISADWGELDDEDHETNNQALIDGSRLLSAYRLKDGTKVWCITEMANEHGQREATTFLLPEEY